MTININLLFVPVLIELFFFLCVCVCIVFVISCMYRLALIHCFIIGFLKYFGPF